VDLPIAENQRLGLSSLRIETSPFEAAKHMTSGRGAAPAGLANPAEEIKDKKSYLFLI